MKDTSMSKAQGSDNNRKFDAEIKKTWNKLSDEDIRLCHTSRDQFFTKLREKHGVSREEGQKKLQEIEKSCCGTMSCAPEKPMSSKAR